MENWKIIEEYPEYEVSDHGNVRSIDRDYVDSWGRSYHKKGQLLKLTEQKKDGYVQIMVTVYSNKKSHRLIVARLVAKAFIPNPDNLPQVNHKDENSTNNHVTNLEWCSAKYNVNYGTALSRRTKKKNKPINVFDSEYNYIETLPSGIAVANKYNICRSSISRSCNKHCLVQGYYFQFL